ncbi:MAG: bacterial proteasome activator family protein [Actinomycetota bacterium]|nr:bacterial proteasome activator family protein [Actinomycetota bacterium]
MSDVPQPSAELDTHPEVVAPDGVEARSEADAGNEAGESVEIESPAKIIRIGAMIKQLLEEVRNTTVDDAARDQLRRIYANSVTELKTALSPELGDELDSLSFDFSGESAPTEAELRMAQAQLVGWLEGLFHGIQATLVAQQMAARQQLEGMRGPMPQIAPQQNVGPGYL